MSMDVGFRVVSIDRRVWEEGGGGSSCFFFFKVPSTDAYLIVVGCLLKADHVWKYQSLYVQPKMRQELGISGLGSSKLRKVKCVCVQRQR